MAKLEVPIEGAIFEYDEVRSWIERKPVPLHVDGGRITMTDITERNNLPDSFIQANTLTMGDGHTTDGVILIGNAIAYDVRGCATKEECSWLMAEKLEAIGNALLSMASDMRG